MNNKKHLVTGILAHVDAGKTTLSESLLYLAGAIRKQGRVDHGDSHLDTNRIEQERGITIFTGQAEMTSSDVQMTLLDTPGHVDFSPEMERTLLVLDQAVLVISAPDGVTGQVRTLWKLLRYYEVPTFIFVNKMDQHGMHADRIMEELKRELSSACVRFQGKEIPEDREEDIAVCDDQLLEQFLEGHRPSDEDIRGLITAGKLFPVCFGSALHNEGVRELLDVITYYSVTPERSEELKLRVFRITHDTKGNRLTWVKVLGGTLHVKDVLPGGNGQRKTDQIRIYSGNSFTSVQEAGPGMVCTVLGLSDTSAGEVIGNATEEEGEPPLLQPVFTRSVLTEEGEDLSRVLRCLQILEEEEPMLHVRTNPKNGRISVQIMGEVQTEILQREAQDRFGLTLAFGPAEIVYRETIAAPVEGVGHYEPLRHYAEVHLLLEPASRGSGITFSSAMRTDALSQNWQKMVLSVLEGSELIGVLTGSEVTDMHVTLIGGKASEKHTEGGDFRQATLRAFRQGLMMAKNILLEPYYDLSAYLPSDNSGRFLTDLRRMDGSAEVVSSDGVHDEITGRVPAAAFGDYRADVRAYTHGQGTVTVMPGGYEPCRDSEKVILDAGYDPESDMDHTPDSIFCSHGAGWNVPWDQVRKYMHVDTGFRFDTEEPERNEENAAAGDLSGKSDGEMSDMTAFDAAHAETADVYSVGDIRKKKSAGHAVDWHEEEKRRAAGEDDLKRIFEKTYGEGSWTTPLHNAENQRAELQNLAAGTNDEERKNAELRTAAAGHHRRGKQNKEKDDYLLVDGYNIIFAWDELRELAARNLDSARDRLIDILEGFQATRSGYLILVFDAYKVRGGTRGVYHGSNIDVVYTKEAETADTYIMRTAHDLKDRGRVTVATSDGIIQMIIFSSGARRMSARELEDEVKASSETLREKYHL